MREEGFLQTCYIVLVMVPGCANLEPGRDRRTQSDNDYPPGESCVITSFGLKLLSH